MKCKRSFCSSVGIIIAILLLFSLPCSAKGNRKEPYTLKVRNGSNITSQLKKALKKQSHIIIPRGSYTCGSVTLPGGKNITLDAKGATIKKGSLRIKGKIGSITIQGGTWDGKHKVSNVFKIDGTTKGKVRLENLVVKNAAKSSVYVSKAKNVTLTNVTSKKAGGNGISLYNCKVKMVNPTIRDSYWFGISVRQGANVTIDGGLITTSGQRPRKTVSRDDAMAGGLSVTQKSSATATGTVFSKNVACGVAAAGDSVKERSTVNLYGVRCTDNGDHGVGARPNAEVRIGSDGSQRSIFQGNAYHGVMIKQGCFSPEISDADFLNNGGMGLNVSEDTTLKKLRNCTFSGNGSYDVYVRYNSAIESVVDCKTDWGELNESYRDYDEDDDDEQDEEDEEKEEDDGENEDGDEIEENEEWDEDEYTGED